MDRIPQYGLARILAIWAAAALPRAALGWVIAPAVAREGGGNGIDFAGLGLVA
jgi:hypothetical protein